MSQHLDGPNDQRVVIDPRLYNCTESRDGIHQPVNAHDGVRCARCAAWLWDRRHPRAHEGAVE